MSQKKMQIHKVLQCHSTNKKKKEMANYNLPTCCLAEI